MPSINEPKRYSVSLTEDQIRGLAIVIGEIRICDVHACRIRAVHEGLQELKDVRDAIRRETNGG